MHKPLLAAVALAGATLIGGCGDASSDVESAAPSSTPAATSPAGSGSSADASALTVPDVRQALRRFVAAGTGASSEIAFPDQTPYTSSGQYDVRARQLLMTWPLNQGGDVEMLSLGRKLYVVTPI